MPQVSIIVPTFNRCSLLVRAVKSVLGQTYRDTEVIVVDDGSTDDTLEAVQSLADHRVILVALDGNCGAPAARNAGIATSHGEFVAFLDSDDYWLPDKLERQMGLLQSHPGCGVAYAPHYYREGDRLVEPAFKCHEGSVFGELASGWCPSLMSSIVVARDLLDECSFDESLCGFQDLDFLLQLARKSHFVAASERLVVVDRGAGDRITASPQRTSALTRIREKWSPLMSREGLLPQFELACERWKWRLAMNQLVTGTRWPKRITAGPGIVADARRLGIGRRAAVSLILRVLLPRPLHRQARRLKMRLLCRSATVMPWPASTGT